MFKNIVFFNHFHNGDIHVSREFIRRLSEVFRNKFPNVNISYSHKNNGNCIIDIPELGYNNFLLNWDPHEGVFINGDTLFINTWYAQCKFRYMNTYGISFDCLYVIFDELCKKHFNFALSDLEPNPEKWFPKIDFSKYEITNAKNKLDNISSRKIFVANNKALSGQAHNFPLLPIINNLANKYPDLTFILTNNEGKLKYQNTIYSSDIIMKNGFDLNENGFVSTYCDVIIGRASGPYTFAFVQENLFEKPKTHICLSNLIPAKENTFWLSDMFRDKVKYTAKIIVSNISQAAEVQNLIEDNLHV